MRLLRIVEGGADPRGGAHGRLLLLVAGLLNTLCRLLLRVIVSAVDSATYTSRRILAALADLMVLAVMVP